MAARTTPPPHFAPPLPRCRTTPTLPITPPLRSCLRACVPTTAVVLVTPLPGATGASTPSETYAGTISLCLKTLSGTTITLLVSATETFGDIKERLRVGTGPYIFYVCVLVCVWGGGEGEGEEWVGVALCGMGLVWGWVGLGGDGGRVLLHTRRSMHPHAVSAPSLPPSLNLSMVCPPLLPPLQPTLGNVRLIRKGQTLNDADTLQSANIPGETMIHSVKGKARRMLHSLRQTRHACAPHSRAGG
jgi:hypothetical protein